MPKRCNARKQTSFWWGWNLAFDALCQELEAVPDDSLPPDAQGFKATLLDWIQERLIDEDALKPRPTNAELAEKYAVSPRTITNWRKDECPFEDGQWSVLDWLAERRYAPARAKTKFARQLERRTDEDLEETDDLASQAAALLTASREWLRLRR